MAITFTDIRDLSAEERKGRLERLVRRGRAKGLTSTSPLSFVQQVLQAPAVPSSGSAIIVGGSKLFLDSRSVLANNDTSMTSALVDLNYVRREESTQNGGTPTLRGGTTLKQIQTNRDRSGLPLSVSYQWPAGAAGNMADGETPRDGAVETQGGMINVLVPMSSIEAEITVATNSPGAITESYAGHVNSVTWKNGEPRTWKCTTATFDLLDNSVSPALYKLFFRFEKDDQTWDNDTTLVFIDVDTNRPPPDVALGTNGGMVVVQYAPERDFNDDF